MLSAMLSMSQFGLAMSALVLVGGRHDEGWETEKKDSRNDQTAPMLQPMTLESTMPEKRVMRGYLYSDVFR